MSSAILTDLQTRIRSNTLTGPQQRALGDALDALIPTFPSPDELAGGIPNTEPVLARDWIAPLYALTAEGSPSVLPTNEIAWWINADDGEDTNPGTEAEPLKRISALGALWRGTAGGGRPVLDPATGTTITVHLAGAFPDDDPLAPILDVDITDGNALILEGDAPTVGHTGAVATANAWARTVANGQVRITDAGVANFGVFAGASPLLEDVTTSAVAWLYGPNSGSSATGTCSPGYSPQTPGAFPSIVQTAIAAGNSYTLSSLTHVALGQGFVTRSFPQEGNSGAQVFFYRLDLGNPASNPQTLMQSPSCGYTWQECMYQLELRPILGGVLLANCFGYATAAGAGLDVRGVATIEVLAGFYEGDVSGQLQVSQGGQLIVDQDLGAESGSPYSVGAGGTLIVGDASYWTSNGGTKAIAIAGGLMIHNPFFGAEGVFYGTDGGTVVALDRGTGPGACVLDTGVTAANQFACTHSNFTCGGLTSAFGFDETAGTYTGPTTCTFAHLDAVLGAGTGFGGTALDPASSCSMAKG